MKLKMVLGSVLVAWALSACGGSPMAPAPVPAPTLPRAELVVVPGQEIAFPDWPCPSGECRYGFEFTNRGPDCARGVSGRLRVLKPDGVTVVADDEWALDSSVIVRVQAVVRVEDGGISKTALDALGSETGQARVAFVFEAVRCS